MATNIRPDYEWLKRDRQRLLITIGESWTWGNNLGSARLDNVFGKQLADRLDADWLNIAECGQSNLWIVDHYIEVIDLISDWKYQHVDIVLTMTEVGREFNGDRDHTRVYTDLLSDIKTFDEFLDLLSEFNANAMRKFLGQYSTWIGTNFVQSNYTNLPVLDKSWIDLIVEYNKQPKPLNRTLVVGSWVYDRFEAVFDFVPALDRVEWKRSVLDHMAKSAHTSRLLATSKLNIQKGAKHPTAIGHKIWADYLYQKITASPDIGSILDQ